MTHASKYERLLENLSGLDSVLVAYSGGVDSTLLAFAAHVVLGERCLAVLARSDTYPESEVEYARRIATELGLRLHEVETYELIDPQFRANTPDRCYYCKSELFGLLRAVADSRGLTYVLDGSNVDDSADFRPGSRAGVELGVKSPLAEVGFTKKEIREVAALLGLPNWDKPSMACLASRFPYGEAITEDRLLRVARAENSLRAMGLRQFRVRAHGDVARLEVEPSEMQTAWEMREIVTTAIKTAGFTFVAQDLDGYRTGAMNEALNAEDMT
ncbi:MAG: ATP-dependent sacrificial sulfur transferase LarE [Coriobacteriia bacterium]|nr:ATP-dependent sacrificial sulfur transferase LarE [Coriobacteriia bacterium]MDO9108835.1 ATP-dependent sacrificial sulfur transferase LarE [Coriobacteriia bacterium]